MPWEGEDQPLADGNWPLISAVAAAVPRRRQRLVARDDARRHGPRDATTSSRATRCAARGRLRLARAALRARLPAVVASSRRSPTSAPTTTAARSRTAALSARGLRARCARPGRRDLPMSVRISAHDWVEGGITPDDAVEIARAVQGRRRRPDRLLVGPGRASGSSRSTAACTRRRSPTASATRPASPTIAVGAISEADHVNSIIAAGPRRPVRARAPAPRRSRPGRCIEAAQHRLHRRRRGRSSTARPRRSSSAISSASALRERRARACRQAEQDERAWTAAHDRRHARRRHRRRPRHRRARSRARLPRRGARVTLLGRDARARCEARRSSPARCDVAHACDVARRRSRARGVRRSAVRAHGPDRRSSSTTPGRPSSARSRAPTPRCGSACWASISPARSCARRRRCPAHARRAGSGASSTSRARRARPAMPMSPPIARPSTACVGLTRALALELATHGRHRQRGVPRLHRHRPRRATPSRTSSPRPAAAEARRAPSSRRAIRRGASSQPDEVAARRRVAVPARRRSRSPGRRSAVPAAR